jgi:hypothetical protein
MVLYVVPIVYLRASRKTKAVITAACGAENRGFEFRQGKMPQDIGLDFFPSLPLPISHFLLFIFISLSHSLSFFFFRTFVFVLSKVNFLLGIPFCLCVYIQCSKISK